MNIAADWVIYIEKIKKQFKIIAIILPFPFFIFCPIHYFLGSFDGDFFGDDYGEGFGS